jgi:ketosteroid isomerase-like protein
MMHFMGTQTGSGRIFSGLEQVQEYFELLQKYLTYEEMVFSEYFADVESRKVSVKGRATFTWTETGESWEEHFVYTIDLDDEAQVTDYQVWADSGALYLASKGELRKVKESSSRPAPLK